MTGAEGKMETTLSILECALLEKIIKLILIYFS
jgi:hypothetical protein